MATAPSGSSATSTQLPLGLLARLLRQRVTGSWSAAAALALSTYMVAPRVTKRTERRRQQRWYRSDLLAACSLTAQVHVQRPLRQNTVQQLYAEVCCSRLVRGGGCGYRQDGTPIEPRGQYGQWHGPLLAGTGGGDGRGGERELAAVAAARSRGLDLLSADRRPFARRAPEAGPGRPGFRGRHLAAMGRRGTSGRRRGRRVRAGDQRAAVWAAGFWPRSGGRPGPVRPGAARPVRRVRGR